MTSTGRFVLFNRLPSQSQESLKKKFDEDPDLLKQLSLIDPNRRKIDIIKFCRTCKQPCSSFWIKPKQEIRWGQVIQLFPGLKEIDPILYGINPYDSIDYIPSHRCSDTEEYLLIYLLTGEMLSMNNNTALPFIPHDCVF